MNVRGPIRLGRKAMRAAYGGVIVIVALLLMLFMQGPGTGKNDAEDSSSTPGETKLVASAAPVDALLTATPNQEPAPAEDSTDDHLTADEKAALSDNTLVVLIDEHNYQIQIPADDGARWTPIELQRLVEVAQQAPGDSNGIRVRIQKRVTARASAEQKILTALQDADIGSDAVFESSELID